MQKNATLTIDLPVNGDHVFRYASMDAILHHLVNCPTASFARGELADMTGYDESSIHRAVDRLEALGVVTLSDERPARVSIVADRLEADDPLLLIPQVELRRPAQRELERLEERVEDHDRLDDVVGVVLFGSVARGTADRASDIDLLVIVTGSKTHARRVGNAVATELAEQRFDGDRYEFEVLVESVDSAKRAGDSLAEIFDEGIVLRGSSTLAEIRTVVYQNEPASSDANRSG